MISQKTKYALKALTFLAHEERTRKGPLLISALAKKGNMPQKFLEAILLELKNHGVLSSKKGKGGGYALAKPPEEIMLGDVIRILEGPLALLPCVSKTAYRRCSECRDEKTCGIRVLFKEVRDATAGILDVTSLAKVCQVELDIADHKNQMYFI